jgi:hypothetical protein
MSLQLAPNFVIKIRGKTSLFFALTPPATNGEKTRSSKQLSRERRTEGIQLKFHVFGKSE